MAKEILTLTDLGRNDSWLLVQQACGIPDPRARSSFLNNTTTVIFFAQDSLPDRLSMTAAVRQMSGHVVYVGPGEWMTEALRFPEELSIMVSYYVDIAMVYGMPINALRLSSHRRTRPLINGGSPDGHPINALADIACMQHYTPDLSQVTVGWVGCANGTLQSLVEATEYFSFRLRVALPEDTIPETIKKAQGEGRNITIVQSPLEAAQGAHYLCAGCQDGKAPHEGWAITPEIMNSAAPKARILLSASPVNSTPIAKELLQSKASLLHRQAENRLRVCKRMLHWVFDQN